MANEYLYFFEVDSPDPEPFARRIQADVEKFGGCVIVSKHEGPRDDGMSIVQVAFSDKSKLEDYIWAYYTDGGLDEDDIRRELAQIRTT